MDSSLLTALQKQLQSKWRVTKVFRSYNYAQLLYSISTAAAAAADQFTFCFFKVLFLSASERSYEQHWIGARNCDTISASCSCRKSFWDGSDLSEQASTAAHSSMFLE